MRAAENSLRDFIGEVLAENLGRDWLDRSGVTPERIERWKGRQEEERRKIRSRGIEERLLYYADFYDLPVILKKHWPLFEPCFGKWRPMDVYLEKLDDFRNPDAHRRDLFPYEINLILGISGFIRTAITNFRSNKSPTDEYFPRFEHVTDSFGNVATPQQKGVSTGRILRPGDEVYFIAKGWDSKGERCQYELGIFVGRTIVDWTENENLKWTVEEEDIEQNANIYVYLRSSRKYHASSGFDDSVYFEYDVLPL